MDTVRQSQRIRRLRGELWEADVLEVSLSAARSRKPAPKEPQRQKEAEYVIQRTALLPMSRNVKHETIRSVAQTKATHVRIARRPNLKEFLFSSATETDIVEGSSEVYMDS